MIGDNTDAKSLLKTMNQNENMYFLFDGHYTNSRTLYSALKKGLNNHYYGILSKKQKEKLVIKYGDDNEEETDIKIQERKHSKNKINNCKIDDQIILVSKCRNRDQIYKHIAQMDNRNVLASGIFGREAF